MAEFRADIRDVKFALFEQAGFERLFKSERYKDLDRATAESILDEAYKFARTQMGPVNGPSDSEGAHHDKATGKVTVPPGLKRVYQLFTENGWLALAHSSEWGGQGMPYSLGLAANDFFFGGCLAFCLQNLLTTGAAHLIEVFGSDYLKKTYLEKMYSGRWAGTMCLTESGAGSDVGAARTKAVQAKDGDHYLLEGQKIFITFGDHDLTDNICHAVLARIEGAPEGTKGLSLFLVPKLRVEKDGSLGKPNDVRCVGIEHKMGIHASPTCTMSFGDNGDCRGWLLGEEHKGMRAMFQMMNEARISVGLQGAALGNAAFQYALGYARDRVQGKNLVDGKSAKILEHPDVRQMLMWQKAYGEGTRALLIRTAVFYDLAEAANDSAEREKNLSLVELLTPVCKSFASDMGFRVTELAMQTLGGYGYLKEYPVEQYLRDTKIASIYEGTNGIQALDLVGRKLPDRGGQSLKQLVGLIGAFAAEHAKHPALGKEAGLLAQATQALVDVSMAFGKADGADRMIPVLNASSYLDLMGHVVVGWLLLEQGVLAHTRLESACKSAGVSSTDAKALAALCEKDEDVRYFQGKVKVAQFFARRGVAMCRAKADVILAGDRSALEVVL